MDKQILEELYLVENLSQREIAKKMNCSQSTVRHYLQKYNLKKHNSRLLIEDQITTKICSHCFQMKNYNEFYARKNGTATSWCKKCNNEAVITRQNNFKQKCIVYKGSKCNICSFDKYNGALEFHHLDPMQKDFNISRYRSYINLSNDIKIELDKCILLCANCHRMVHANIIKLN